MPASPAMVKRATLAALALGASAAACGGPMSPPPMVNSPDAQITPMPPMVHWDDAGDAASDAPADAQDATVTPMPPMVRWPDSGPDVIAPMPPPMPPPPEDAAPDGPRPPMPPPMPPPPPDGF